MSFRFFRKHQKAMLWVVVIITVATFSIFSVTSTMEACFRQGSTENNIGSFVSMTGEEVSISERMYREALQIHQKFGMVFRFEKISDEMLIQHIILAHEAREAGLVISDAELGEKINAINDQFKIKTSQEYDELIRKMQFGSRKLYEQALREFMMVARFQHFAMIGHNPLLSEELYNRFKPNNEEFKLAYATFSADSFADQIDPASVTDVDLAAFFEELPDYDKDVREHLSVPEQFIFDAAWINIAEAKLADYEDLISKDPLDSQQVKAHYNLTRDRFLIEEEPGEEEEPGDGSEPDDGTGTDNDDNEGAEKEPVYKTFEEVQDQMENEYKLASLVKSMNEEWAEYTREQGIVGRKWEDVKKEKEAEASKGEEKNEEGSDPKGEENAPPETKEESELEVDPEAFLDQLVAKYRLERKTFTSFVSIDDMPGLEGIGTEQLKTSFMALKINNSRYIAPNNERPDLAMFIRVIDMKERVKKPLAEVREKVLRALSEGEATQPCRRGGRCLRDPTRGSGQSR